MAAAVLTSPFTAALDRLDAKSPVASTLTSAEWAQVPLALRERSFFSARVAQADTVALLQHGIRQALSLEGESFMDPAKFVATIRQAIGAAPGDTGELTDLASRKRLELIYKFNTEEASEYGRWQAQQDPDLLAAYPAQELVRIMNREEPRDWQGRWSAQGGKFYAGRMIALKDDPIWAGISRFRRPWPPFDFGSGMGLEDIDRAEAEALGLLLPEDPAPLPQKESFNAKLEASAAGLSPDLASALVQSFGGAARLVDGVIRWIGGAA